MRASAGCSHPVLMSQTKEITVDITEDVTLTREERDEASQAAEDAYMRAITEQGRKFMQTELDFAIYIFIEAAKNVKFLGFHGYTR